LIIIVPKKITNFPVDYSNPYSPVLYVAEYSFVQNLSIFGDLENYTFLETLGPTETEKQCLHFFSEHPMAAIFDFQNGDYFL